MFSKSLRIFPLLGAALLALAGPAVAQSVYGTAAGQNVKVVGVVPLQCNSGGAACAPVTAANPAGPSQVVGNVASGAADSGNPVKVGGVYNSANPAPATGQRVDMQMDGAGQVRATISKNFGTIADGWNFGYIAAPYIAELASPGPLATFSMTYNGATLDIARGDKNGIVTQPALSATFWQYAAVTGGIVSSTADVAVKAAAGAGVRNYVCTIDISHDVLSAASEIVAKDGSTVIWRGKLQTPAIDVGAGAGKITFTPCLRGTANTAVNVAMITSATGGVFVNASGYTGS